MEVNVPGITAWPLEKTFNAESAAKLIAEAEALVKWARSHQHLTNSLRYDFMLERLRLSTMTHDAAKPHSDMTRNDDEVRQLKLVYEELNRLKMSDRVVAPSDALMARGLKRVY